MSVFLLLLTNEIKVRANYGALENVTVLIALDGALLMMIMLVLIRMTMVMLVMNDVNIDDDDYGCVRHGDGDDGVNGDDGVDCDDGDECCSY